MKRILAALFVIMAFAAICGAQDYIVGEGDVLKVSVWGFPEFGVDVTVRPDGKITVPAAGDVGVSGMTPPAIAEKLSLIFSKYVKTPLTTVTVSKITNNKVYLTGEGVASGVVNLPGRTTLFKFLAGVGDMSNADLRNAYVIRGEKRVYSDFYELFSTGDISKDFALLAEDIIYIPSLADNKLYIVGEVKSPRAVVVVEGLNVLDVVLDAGGFSENANRDYVELIRDGKVISVNIGAISTGKDVNENIKVRKGDYIVVSGFTEQKIYVTGAVNRQTNIIFRKGIRILDAIYEAGGFSEHAKKKEVSLIRDGTEKTVINVDDLLEGDDLSKNVLLEPGDFIVVPESFF